MYGITTYTLVNGFPRERYHYGPVDIGLALGSLLSELPQEAWTMTDADAAGNPLPAGSPGITRTRIDIDWAKVPEDTSAPHPKK